MKYIDADLLRKDIEFAKSVYDNPKRVVHGVADAFRQDGRAAMCDDILKKIDSLQQEQPMPDSTKLIELWHEDKEMLKEKDFRDDPWRLAHNAFLCGFSRGLAVKQEQPENTLTFGGFVDKVGTWFAHLRLDKFRKTFDGETFPATELVQRYDLFVRELEKQYSDKHKELEVDLEKELEQYARNHPADDAASYRNLIGIARHFYELGFKARNEE